MTFLYVLLAILLLAILIIAHEFGHFISARLCGIEVQEFSVGFGPKLLGTVTKRGTAVSLRAVPLGGYCAFYGEDDAEGKHQDDPRAYNRQPVWKRMISVLMGPGMNFILALVVAVGYYWIGGVGVVQGYTPYISEVAAAGPAYEAGLQANDTITQINGVDMLDGTTSTLLGAISGWQEGDAPLTLTVQRGDETFTTELTPFYDEEEGKYRIGITVSALSDIAMQPCSFTEACQYGWSWCTYAGSAILDALKNLVTTGEGLEETTGPVGIVSTITTEMQTYGIQTFLDLLVLISINLGIMNLLPIPGLDGSRFIFMLIEAIRRKPVPPEKEAIVHLVGYVFLLGLAAVLTVRDIMHLF